MHDDDTRHQGMQPESTVGQLCASLCILSGHADQLVLELREQRFGKKYRGSAFVMRALWILSIAVVIALAGFWAVQLYRSEPPPHTPAAEYLSDFSLPDLDDNPRSIMEWSGTSLIINFWATWCAPCRREMPLLQNLQDQRDDGSLQVVGIAMDNLRDARRFVSQAGINYPILYGEYEVSVIAESFGEDFIGLPFSVFVTADGQIVALWPGELSADELRQAVAELDAVASNQSSVTQARERLAAE